MINKIKNINPLYLSFLIGITYSILVFVNPYKNIFYGDVGLMYVQVQDIIEGGYSDFSLKYKGEEVDPEYKFFPYTKPFLAEINNKHYFVFPPYYLFINTFLFQLFGVNGLYILNLISFVFTLILIYKLGKYFDLENRFINLSVLLYVFGMTASNYNFVFHELTFAIFWITISLYFLFLFFETNKNIHLVLFTFLGAISLFFRLEFIFILFAAGLSLVFYKRKNIFSVILFSILGLVVPFFFLLFLNLKIHNHPLGLRYLLNMTDSSVFSIQEKLGIINDLLFSKSISLFAQSPYILICFIFPFLRKRIQSSNKFFLFFIVSLSAICILLTSPNNGGHISPRYLFGVYPLLSILSIISYKSLVEYANLIKSEKEENFLWKNATSIIQILFLILIVLSFYSTFRNYQWLQRASNSVLIFDKQLKVLAEDNPIIFRDYSQPLNAQSLYLDQMTFVMEKLEFLPSLLDKLKLAGKEKVLLSEAFASEMNFNSRLLAENIYTKSLNLSQKEDKYYFPDGKKYVTFHWIEYGKKQTLLVLNIFLN